MPARRGHRLPEDAAMNTKRSVYQCLDSRPGPAPIDCAWKVSVYPSQAAGPYVCGTDQVAQAWSSAISLLPQWLMFTNLMTFSAVRQTERDTSQHHHKYVILVVAA